MLQRTAETLSQIGHRDVRPSRSARRPRASPGRRSAGWCCCTRCSRSSPDCGPSAGCASPALFGREFRAPQARRLHRLDAGRLLSCCRVRLAPPARDRAGRRADDVVFVLAAAFLVQALAVVHGLRELQVIGLLPVDPGLRGGAAGADGAGRHRFRGHLVPLSRKICKKVIIDGSHPVTENRQPRRHRRPREGQAGLRPQFPAAGRQGDARDGGERGEVREPPRGARGEGRGRPRGARSACGSPQGFPPRHHGQGGQRGQAVRLDRHDRHRRGLPAGGSRDRARRSPPAGRPDPHGRRARRSRCTCTATSTSRCR